MNLRQILLVTCASVLLPAAAVAQNPGIAAVWQSDHFTVTAVSADRVPPIEDMPVRIDELFEYVSERVGVSGDMLKAVRLPPSLDGTNLQQTIAPRLFSSGGRVNVNILGRDTGVCPLRGRAMPGAIQPSIEIFADESTPADQFLAVLAHEVGHLFQHLGMEAAGVPSAGLDQGFASWAAGRYWSALYNATSLTEAARGLVRSGSYVPLTETSQVAESIFPRPDGSAEPGCLERRNALFTGWAAFYEYLVAAHGRDKLFELLSSATGNRDDADRAYLMVYDDTLKGLEANWLRTLE